VHYLVAWEPPSDLATRFPNLRLAFSIGAGVDQFDFTVLPAHVPLVRMLEPGLMRGMVEYVLHAVLDLHRDMPAYRRAQQRREWKEMPVRTAPQRRVGVLGLGWLGAEVATQLARVGFDCAGWSRSARVAEGVQCFAGADALDEFLARSEILICLLPLTAQTQGFLNSALFAHLPQGAALVQVGRGRQLVTEDLRAALDSGQLSEAVLDVVDPEPLPTDHWLWKHERVRITPHIASQTVPQTAARAVIDNLRRFESGEPLIGLVDRLRGY
jgi:glyoxylate/hydroxypyruvate reductase A